MWPWMRLLDGGRSSRTPAYGADRRRLLVAVAAAAACGGFLALGATRPESAEPPVAPPPAAQLPRTEYVAPEPTQARTDVRALPRVLADADVHLVPVGRVSPGMLENASARLSAQLTIVVSVLAPIDAPTAGMRGRQLSASEVARVAAIPHARRRGETVIAVTELDVGPSLRSDREHGVTVISTAELDPVNFGLGPDPTARDERLYELLLPTVTPRPST